MKLATERNIGSSCFATIFWASTRNKQLNFLQHVFTILKQHGRAAIVIPENDSHLPNCSPFGLPVHVGRYRDLYCPLQRRRRRMPAR
jgi:hypothetical protein